VVTPLGVDPAEVVAKDGYAGYPVDTQPDPNYKASLMILVGTAQPTVLSNTRVIPSVVPQEKLLVVEYSGDDILARPK